MPSIASLIHKVDPYEAMGYEQEPKYRVKYPDGVVDDYGHTYYYFRTLKGARLMARKAAKAAPGDRIFLEKDWTI